MLEITEERLEQARVVVRDQGKEPFFAVSLIHRRMQPIGYVTAAKIVDQLVEEGTLVWDQVYGRYKLGGTMDGEDGIQ